MTRVSQRFGAWSVGLGAIALAAVLRNQPGDYVVDNRFEQYWNPGRRIARTFTLWDATRGLGRVREELWPGVTAPVALFRMLGASPALAEHLWHASLLTLAGTGMVALLRRYRPSLGVEHLAAALLYTFGPYATTFLVPSNLFLHYALAPWLAVAAHVGVHAARPWRAAAAFALLVFAAGNVDTPGLLFALVGVALVVAHAVVVERTARARGALAWLGRAAALTALVSGAAVAKTVLGADAFSQRLESTETVQVISTTSSWSESIRGLGLWLSYFRDAGGHIRPEGEPWFTSGWLVLATFAPVTIGLGALWFVRRWRTQVLFVALLVVGTLLMVGAHPYDDPAPWGRLWRWAVRELPVAGTLRTTYKAGSIAGIGVAALFGTGLADAIRRFGTDRLRRGVLLGGGAVVLVAVSVPVWSGGLYAADRRMDEVPAHWRDAISWLDAQPGDGQVLVLPGATRAVYRWGWPGDDIFDALMDRAHLTNAAVSLSRPLVADVLEALDEAAVDGGHQPGSFAPLLRRLGISHVVLRNDLDWQRMGVARPARFSDLRDEPGLELAATFGRPDGAARPSDGADARAERALPPVEVFAVTGAPSRSRTLPAGPWTLLEGSGAAWPSLAASGLLDEDAPIVPAALLDGPTLSRALSEGGRLLVTDTNRRRAQALTAFSSERSRTLGAAEDVGRPIPDLYGRSGSQSVAVFADATSIDDPAVFRSLAGFRPQYRPALAFDGDPRTGWVIGSRPDPRSRTLRVQLRRPAVVDHVVLRSFDPRDPDRSADPAGSFSGVPRIGRVELVFSDGTSEHVNLITGRADVRFRPHRTSSLSLRVLDVTEADDVGIAEIAFPGSGLDLVEHVRVPDDAARLSAHDRSLRSQLEAAEVSYILDRVVGRATAPVEPQLRREVWTAGSRAFTVRGRVSGGGDDVPPADSEGCSDIGLRVDGHVVPVRLGSADGPARFRACAPVSLDDGWHRIEGSGTIRIDHLELASAARPVARAALAPRLQPKGSPGTAARTFTADGRDGGLLLPGDGYDRRWHASLDGVDLGPAVPVDAQNAWLIPAGTGPAELQVELEPDRWFRAGLATSLGGVAICVALVVPRRRVR